MQVTGEDFQIVYYDTPGVLRPNYKLQVQTHIIPLMSQISVYRVPLPRC